MLVTFDENGMPVYDLDAAIDITRMSLIEEGIEIGMAEGIEIGRAEGIKIGYAESIKIARKNIITKLISNGMGIEELSQKLNMSIADINSILNQNVTN